MPVGQAWNRAIAQGSRGAQSIPGSRPGQINLWASDGYHASTFGYYLEALVIFGSVTGRDPRVLGRKSRLRPPAGHSPAMAVELQAIAFATLAKEAKR